VLSVLLGSPNCYKLNDPVII